MARCPGILVVAIRCTSLPPSLTTTTTTSLSSTGLLDSWARATAAAVYRGLRRQDVRSCLACFRVPGYLYLVQPRVARRSTQLHTINQATPWSGHGQAARSLVRPPHLTYKTKQRRSSRVGEPHVLLTHAQQHYKGRRAQTHAREADTTRSAPKRKNDAASASASEATRQTCHLESVAPEVILARWAEAGPVRRLEALHVLEHLCEARNHLHCEVCRAHLGFEPLSQLGDDPLREVPARRRPITSSPRR